MTAAHRLMGRFERPRQHGLMLAKLSTRAKSRSDHKGIMQTPAEAILLLLVRLADLENSLDQLREEVADWKGNADQLGEAFKSMRLEMEQQLTCLGRS